MAEANVRTAIVTGSGQGMGLAVALKLASMGTSLVVNDVDPARADAAAEKVAAIGGRAVAVPADITSKVQVEQMVSKAVEAFGGVHILINNAGILYPTSTAEMPEQEGDRVSEGALKGTFLCAQARLPPLNTAGWGPADAGHGPRFGRRRAQEAPPAPPARAAW